MKIRHKNGVEGYAELAGSAIRLAHFFRLFALPARIVILDILLAEPDWLEASRFQLLPLSYAAIENHLRHLRKEKLVERVIIDNTPFYRANSKALDEMMESMLPYIKQIALRLQERNGKPGTETFNT